MIAGINESKILTKHVLCECKCKFDGRKCKLNQKWNIDKCRCKCKNLKEHNACEKDYIWNSSTCICGNGECLASSIDDLVNTSDKVIDGSGNVMNTVSTNFHKKVRYKTDCYILHTILLVIILLLITAIICYHFAKHTSKLKNILSC